MTWYYARNGQRFGPVEASELQRLASSGQLGAGDLVWQPGLPEWKPASEIPELAACFRPATPAPYSPYTPPAAPLTQPPPPYGLVTPGYGTVAPIGATAVPEYASFGSRFAAFLIDQLILLCLGGAIGAVIGVGMVMSGETPTGEEFIWNIVGLLAGWIYYAGMESSAKMGTFGKSLLGLSVVDLQGQRIDFGRATGRYFGKILSTLVIFLGFILTLLCQIPEPVDSSVL